MSPRPPMATLLLVLGVVTALSPRVGADTAKTDEADTALASARAIEQDLVNSLNRIQAASVTVLGRCTGGSRVRGGPPRPQPLASAGSGVLVSYRGTWVVTSEHVIDGENQLEVVTSDGRSHPVRLHARDRHSDLALLAFRALPDGLQPVVLGGPEPPVIQEGSWVLATGNPFFLALDGGTVASLGVVSGTRPGDVATYIDEPTLQHDAEINPGSSGGPLWNLEGELVGINGTIATRSRAQGGGGPAHTGASFSVPLSALRRFLRASCGTPRPAPTPRTHTRVAAGSTPARTRTPRASLGLVLGTRGRSSGAVVTSVERAGPAAGALRPGDVITRVTLPGRAFLVQTAADVDRVLAQASPGVGVSLRFMRGGRLLNWSGLLGAP